MSHVLGTTFVTTPSMQEGAQLSLQVRIAYRGMTDVFIVSGFKQYGGISGAGISDSRTFVVVTRDHPHGAGKWHMEVVQVLWLMPVAGKGYRQVGLSADKVAAWLCAKDATKRQRGHIVAELTEAIEKALNEQVK